MNPQTTEQPIEIRDLAVRDIAAFAVLRHRIAEQNQFSLPANGFFQDNGESFAEQIARTLRDPAHKRILALRAGRLAGFVSVFRDGNTAQLEIGVDAASVGQGVGRQLMEAVETWACAAGLACLELDVAPANVRAIALYERCGFYLDPAARGTCGVTHHMRKILD